MSLKLYARDENGIARKGLKIYAGVDNVARAVKKIYKSENGVATLWYEKVKELSYYGTATPLNNGRRYFAATTVGDYALFAGGYANSGDSVTGLTNSVEVYNKSLTRSTISEGLVEGVYLGAATTIGNYAIFAGGGVNTTPFRTSIAVTAYDTSLTKIVPTSLSIGRYQFSATSVGDYALFGGGYANSNYPYSNNVDAYNSSLTRTAPTALSVGRYVLGATNVAASTTKEIRYALFAGGISSNAGTDGETAVDVYNSSLSRSYPAALNVGRYSLGSTNVISGYAFFAGGSCGKRTTSGRTNIVECYGTGLTKTYPAVLSEEKTEVAATSLGEYVLFAGGINYSGKVTDTVDAYDVNLIKTVVTPLSEARREFEASSVGNYALFVGGFTPEHSSIYCETVDVYQFN